MNSVLNQARWRFNIFVLVLIELGGMSRLSSQQHSWAVLSVEGQRGSHHHPWGSASPWSPLKNLSVLKSLCVLLYCHAWSDMISWDVCVVIKISGWWKEQTRGLEDKNHIYCSVNIFIDYFSITLESKLEFSYYLSFSESIISSEVEKFTGHYVFVTSHIFWRGDKNDTSSCTWMIRKVLIVSPLCFPSQMLKPIGSVTVSRWIETEHFPCFTRGYRVLI